MNNRDKSLLMQGYEAGYSEAAASLFSADGGTPLDGSTVELAKEWVEELIAYMPKVIIKEKGVCYYFSHKLITQYERNEVKFVDKNGIELKPSYFGAGLNGMSATLK